MNRSEAVELYTKALKEEIEGVDTLAACRSFSELHDHTDANMLADKERVLIEKHFHGEDVMEIVGASQDLVDIWLANKDYEWATVDRSDAKGGYPWKGRIFRQPNEETARSQAWSFGYTVLKRKPGEEWAEA
ncbi:hypothetical protein L3Y21_gp005 [Gordonia phage Rabbitrun]|uniref:Uncharacterized protein n=1 Tax=Gordonia phage Rabbitrun TaxID=2762280 RepID=A0A7G8LIH7_9CAUD|nr:hypothetical protein L3Y21_gp005 [Gordonia phage Rabbitrun]QNJ57049.1 hypothetical protein SEA_RABBITRUN_5 [Gordonia phage Rabbitrun]